MKKTNWFLVGQATFGLLIGLFVGLSVSEVVVSVIALLFAFIGGSLLVLMKGKTNEELSLIGLSITFLSVSIAVGALSGVYLRVNNSLDFRNENVLNKKNDDYIYTYDKKLSFDNIVTMSKSGMSDDSMCYLISKGMKKLVKDEVISADNMKKLYKNKIGINSLKVMFEKNYLCSTGEESVDSNKQSETAVYGGSGGSIFD